MSNKTKQLLNELIETQFEEAINNAIAKLSLEKFIQENLKELMQKEFQSSQIEVKLKERMDYLFNNQIDLIISENGLMETINNHQKEFEEKIVIILNNMLDQKNTKKQVMDHIEETYMYDLQNVCVMEHIMDQVFENYELQFVAKLPKKKRKK